MNYKMRKPCAECPFLKSSIKGWLGPDKPQEVHSKVHLESPVGYPCHMDVTAKIKEGWKESDPAIVEVVEQCAGALLHAAKTHKSFRDRVREAAKDKLVKLFGLDSILGFDFIKHHTTGYHL